MTREEAIKWINIRMCMGRGKFTEHHPPIIDEVWEAGLMAIEALSVDLVLCKECKYYKPEFYACTAKGWNLSATHYPKVHESGYCYRRKRRSDD